MIIVILAIIFVLLVIAWFIGGNINGDGAWFIPVKWRYGVSVGETRASVEETLYGGWKASIEKFGVTARKFNIHYGWKPFASVGTYATEQDAFDAISAWIEKNRPKPQRQLTKHTYKVEL